jgi:hypothetical protein
MPADSTFRITDEILAEVERIGGRTARGEYERAPASTQEKLLEQMRELPALDRQALIDKTADAIHSSAIMGRFRGNHENVHGLATACYRVCQSMDEASHAAGCEAIGNTYQSAYNSVVASQGYDAQPLSACTCK